jgi:transposase
MRYVGIDVHKSFSRVVSFDPATGEVQDLGSVPTQWEVLCGEVRRLEGEKTVVLEAGRNSHFLAAKLEGAASRVWIVDPAALRRLVPKGTKTDARDAKGLAEWAAAGKLTSLWRPAAKNLELRELTRGKQLLTGMQAQVRNQVRALLARHGFEVGRNKDLLSAGVQQWLEEVTPKLNGYAQQVLAVWRALLPALVAQAKGLEPAIVREAKVHPQARRLQSLPGVGWYLGLTLAVEIDDVARFEKASQLRAYSGLCPSVSQSGLRTHYGPLTKRGNRYLRGAAGLAAQAASNRTDLEPRLRRLHARVAFKHGKNPAKMQLARALLTLAHHLLVYEEDYQPRPVRA